MLTKEVPDFLVVDLHELAPNEHLKLVGVTFALATGHWSVDDVEHVVKDIGHDSLHIALGKITHHGVGFAATCLPVRKHRTVIPLEGFLNERESCTSVDLLLLGVFIENLVEAECLVVSVFGVLGSLLLRRGLRSCSGFKERNLAELLINSNCCLLLFTSLDLPLDEGTTPQDDFDTLRWLLRLRLLLWSLLLRRLLLRSLKL